ncbi:MAG: NfeD family protein [Planctomycetota bacterium]
MNAAAMNSKQISGLLFIAVLFSLMISACGRAAGDQQQDSNAPSAPTVIVEINGGLNIAHQARLAKAIRDASAYEGSWLIVSIDTLGGSVEIMGAMGNALREASTSAKDITTVAFVSGGDAGGAWSAGSFLALACDRIYMKNGTQIGAALPVVPAMLPTGFGIESADKFASGKVISMLAARFREYAKQTNRSEGIAAAFVDPTLGVYKVRLPDGRETVYSSDELTREQNSGKNISILKEYQAVQSDRPLVLSANDAFDAGFSQGTVSGFDDLLSTIGRESSALVQVEPFTGERFVELINIATPVLLLLGIVLGFLETKIPGFGLAGTISTLCFGLVFYGRYLLGAAEILHIILFAIGLLLIAVELFFAAGTLYAGVLGVIFIILSLFLSFQNFIIPRDGLDADLLVQNMSWASGIFLTSTIIIFFLSRYLPSAPLVRRMVLARPSNVEGTGAGAAMEASLVGKTARATSDLRPAGTVEIDGRRLDAVTEGSYISRGSLVRILEVSGNRIVVIIEDTKNA